MGDGVEAGDVHVTQCDIHIWTSYHWYTSWQSFWERSNGYDPKCRVHCKVSRKLIIHVISYIEKAISFAMIIWICFPSGPVVSLHEFRSAEGCQLNLNFSSVGSSLMKQKLKRWFMTLFNWNSTLLLFQESVHWCLHAWAWFAAHIDAISQDSTDQRHLGGFGFESV